MAAEWWPPELTTIYDSCYPKTSELSNLESTRRHPCLGLTFKSCLVWIFNVNMLPCRGKDSAACCQIGCGNWYLLAKGTLTDLTDDPEALGLVRFLLLGAHSLQEHQLSDKPAPARTPANTSVSAPLRLCLCLSSLTRCSQSPPHRLLFSPWMMSCKYRWPYTTALMPVFIPLILTRLPLKATGMLNRGLDNSLRGQNEHPSPEWRQHFQLTTASSHCAEDEQCFIHRQGTKLKAQDESC